MITQKDKEIIKHIDKYGFITNRQCREIFMAPSAVKGYEVARRRLKVIQESNPTFGTRDLPLTMKRNILTNENIYFYNKYPSYHDIQVMNVYSRLIYLGIEVQLFKQNVSWRKGKQKSDAFFVCQLDGISYACLLEVCVTNNDPHIKGYEELHRIGEIQSKLNGTFPRIILVGHRGPLPKTNLIVKSVEEDLSNIITIFRD